VSKSGEERKPRVWVLDTETKGTGAEMRPLDTLPSAGGGRGVVVVQPPKPPPEKPPEPKLPRRFKVVDVMTLAVLAEDVDTRTAVDVLEGIRSSVDVSLYVWEPKAGKWQQLTQREKQMVWALRGRRGDARHS
jgi:hypothetical protein